MSPAPVRRILIVDDDAEIRRVVRRILDAPELVLDEAASLRAARELLPGRRYDLVLSDVRLGAESGLEILSDLRRLTPPVPLILMTAYAEVESAVSAMREGVSDYLVKPFLPEEVRLAVRRALVGARPSAPAGEDGHLASLGAGPSETFEGMTGAAPAMRILFAQIARIAPTDATVLLQGESGTGKELAARAIHARSRRASGTFTGINCAAIPATLLESELFGHERGAFTGAVRAKPGLFEAADGGTLLLDEVGEIPGPLQAKLLRVLEERSITRLGSNRPRPIDVRIVAATNRDLAEAVRTGVFREDLYYRLRVIPLRIPPLRERMEDIPILARRFLEAAAGRLGRSLSFSPEAISALQQREYPGNIRELENSVERLAILSEGSEIRSLEALGEV